MTLSNELTIDDVETELHDILALPAADFDDEDFTYPPNGYMRLRSFRWIRDWVSLGVELTEDEAAFYAGMIERNQIGPLLGPAWIDGYYRVVFPGDWESWTNDSITARLIWAETVVSSGNPINALMSFDQLAYTDLANANQFSRQHIRSRLRESDPDSARNYCLVRLLAGFYDDTGASYSSTTRSGFSLIRPDEHDFLGLLIAPETSPSPRLITATETIYRDHQVSGGGSACVEDEVIPEC